MGESTMRGRCLCGSVTFEIDPPVLSCACCHCESCRRQCSAPFAVYIGVAEGTWRWTGAAPKIHRSSPGVERSFCGTCGSPMSFRSEHLSGTMHLFAAALEDPGSVQPQLHVAFEEKLSWLEIGDSLPRHRGPDYL